MSLLHWSTMVLDAVTYLLRVIGLNSPWLGGYKDIRIGHCEMVGC